MLKIENVVLPSPEQWMFVVRGMRNPKNSWDKIDSYFTHIENPETLNTAPFQFFLGERDRELMMNLAKGGPVHAKYRRQLPVALDIIAPLYWWKEFETYRVGIAPNPTDIEFNSCSTMHKITSKEFTLDDFSYEHLLKVGTSTNGETVDVNGLKCTAMGIFTHTINALNFFRKLYLETKDKKYWWQLIQLLPSSYNQRRSVTLNYQVLSELYYWRKDHKLDEWHVLCDWIESLPYSDLIVGDLEKQNVIEPPHCLFMDSGELAGILAKRSNNAEIDKGE